MGLKRNRKPAARYKDSNFSRKEYNRGFFCLREAREAPMRLRKTLTFLILAIGLALALPAGAEENQVAQGPRVGLRLFHRHVRPRRCPRRCNRNPQR